jgi:hypothetical protein
VEVVDRGEVANRDQGPTSGQDISGEWDRYRRGNNSLFLFVIEKFRLEYEINVILVDDPEGA